MIVIGTAMARILPLAVGIGDIASWVAAAATLGLLIAAVLAGKTALDTLRAQRLAAQRQRVYDLLARTFDEDFIRMGILAETFFDNPPKTPTGWARRWKATSSDEGAVIQAVMNFYEVVAGEYNTDGVLDRQLADKALMVITYAWWKRAEPFANWVRDNRNPQAFEEWRAASDAYEKAYPEKAPVA